MALNKVKFTVCGSPYVVSTQDPEEYVISIAERLDKDIKAMLDSAPHVSIATAAVITAMSYLDDLEKSTSGADNMRAQIRDYLEDASKAKMSAEEARRESEQLRREVAMLKAGK